MGMEPSVAEVARGLLARGETELADIRVFVFENDGAHDDGLQEQIRKEFIAAFDAAQLELTNEFGPAARIGDIDVNVIPLSGILRFAIWEVNGNQLYIAAAHEDRECPLLLMLGINA
jgi:hypothetical protein